MSFTIVHGRFCNNQHSFDPNHKGQEATYYAPRCFAAQSTCSSAKLAMK